MMVIIGLGDYVLATKFTDGDPHDHFVVGFVNDIKTVYGISETTQTKYCFSKKEVIYHIVGMDGKLFRGNGFRRAEKISKEDGAFLIENIKNIEKHDSVWDFYYKYCKNHTK
jgi:hypothetical protein